MAQLIWLLLLGAVTTGSSPAAPQIVLARSDLRSVMQSDVALGLLHGQADLPETRARQRCLSLPFDPPNNRLQGPHGDSLVTTRCEVLRYRALGTGSKRGWYSVEYRWVSFFTAEDTSLDPAARDTVSEDEVVLLAGTEAGRVRPIWHERFETGDHALWRSVTPEIARFGSVILLSIQHCVNGTGGCNQDFLQQSPGGRWTAVHQVWLEQLPRDLAGRLQHGVGIDVHALRGEGALYGPRDPNCCPSELLRVQLGLRGDSLVLRSRTVVPIPTATSP